MQVIAGNSNSFAVQQRQKLHRAEIIARHRKAFRQAMLSTQVVISGPLQQRFWGFWWRWRPGPPLVNCSSFPKLGQPACKVVCAPGLNHVHLPRRGHGNLCLSWQFSAPCRPSASTTPGSSVSRNAFAAKCWRRPLKPKGCSPADLWKLTMPCM